MILSFEFLKFLQYLCFRGQEIHCWHSYWAWATMFSDFENPGQLPVQIYSKVLMIVSYKFLISSPFMFRGQATEFWHFYRATMFGWPQKSRSTSGSGGTDDSVLWIFEISLLFMFSGQGIHCWYSYWTTSFGWPQKSGSTPGSRGFWGHPNKVAQ